MRTPSPWSAALLLAPAVALAQAGEQLEVEWKQPWASAYGWMWWVVIAVLVVAALALSARGWYRRRPGPR